MLQPGIRAFTVARQRRNFTGLPLLAGRPRRHGTGAAMHLLSGSSTVGAEYTIRRRSCNTPEAAGVDEPGRTEARGGAVARPWSDQSLLMPCVLP